MNIPIPRIIPCTLLRSLILMAGVFCAPSIGLETGFLQSPSAIADCGDWLVRHDAHFVMNRASQIVPQNASSAVATASPSMPVADQNRPMSRCRGPLCDRAPAPLPAPEQPGVSRVIPSDWGDWHPEDIPIATEAGIVRFSASEALAGRDDARRLERPPQAA